MAAHNVCIYNLLIVEDVRPHDLLPENWIRPLILLFKAKLTQLMGPFPLEIS
jgi:hypothetical protein